jgi:hypothetical protein
MSASITTELPVSRPKPVPSTACARPNRCRRITVEAGHALEILGHAIEYLTDELVHNGGDMSSSNAQLETVQLLMKLNRQVYFECPEVLTIWERLRSLLHLRVAYKSSEDHGLHV